MRSPFAKVTRSHDQFAHRGDFDLRKLRGGKLSFRIEFSNRINRVAKELDARRGVMSRRPDIEDAAAYRELSNRAHGIFTDIATGEELFDKFFRRSVFVATKYRAGSRDFIRCDRASGESARRKNHQVRPVLRQPPQSQRAAF